MLKLHKFAALQVLEHDGHVLAHTQFFAADFVVLDQIGAFQNVAPGRLQFVHADVREARLQTLLNVDLGLQKIATVLRDHVQLHGGELHLLVFEQTAHQFGSWVFGFFAFGHLFGRQQHARFDLDQHGRHQQVFGRQLQIALPDFFNIGQVLARDASHRNVEDVEVLLSNQIEQQIQRAFESLKKHL